MGKLLMKQKNIITLSKLTQKNYIELLMQSLTDSKKIVSKDVSESVSQEIESSFQGKKIRLYTNAKTADRAI